MPRPVALVLALALLAGCVEERVIRSSGPLQDLPGATGGIRPADSTPAKGAAGVNPDNPLNYPTPPGMDENLRVELPSGQVRLVSRNPRELMFHLRQSLAAGDPELVAQLLSEPTLQAYRARAMHPDEAAAFLIEHRDAIIHLLNQFPMGERTPGVFVETIGPNRFRIQAPSEFISPPLLFRRLDYIFERDACRLLMIS